MNSRIYDSVELPDDAVIGPFCVIGHPFRGMQKDNSRTVFAPGTVIRSHTVVYAGNSIGRNFQTGHHVFIRECNIIGNDVSIGTLSVVEHHVEIGDGVRLHSQVFIPEFSVLEDNVWIGPNVVLTNATYPQGMKVKEKLRGPRIRKGAIIGANATILPGIHIGVGALIGAGSVVTHDVPDRTIVAGNPARPKGSVEDLRYEDGQSVYTTRTGK